MTKTLVPLALAAATLTAAPAFAQHRGDRDHDRGRGSRGAVVVRPYGGVYVARRPVYAPRYYYRPYYSFRPRFSIGFGITVGYPVTYPVYAPYAYGYPAPYGYPPPYSQSYPSQPYPQQGYPAESYPSYPSQPYPSQQYPQGGYASPQAYPDGNNSMQVQPPRDIGNQGGVSFEISPSDAEIFVDGNYAGTVDQFGPQTEPLKLVAGRHRIELRASGMQPMAFDATITAGQVIPYRGALQQR